MSSIKNKFTYEIAVIEKSLTENGNIVKAIPCDL